MSHQLLTNLNQQEVLSSLPAPSDPILKNNILFVDNTAIEDITTCPWKAYARLILRRKPSSPTPALTYGAHIHEAMALRNLALAANDVPDVPTMHKKLDECFAKEPTGEDWRSLGMAQELVRKYHMDHLMTNETVVILPDGRPAVELPFAIYLGIIGLVVVIYIGKIDVVVRVNNMLYVKDYKTTSRLGDGFWRDAEMSPQQRGYCYAYREIFGEEPNGYIIAALASRAPTKTGTSLEFAQRSFYTRYPESQLDEWRDNCLEQCRTFITYHERQFFPRHYAMHCEGKYGKCPFFEVCSMPSSQRQVKLMGGDYTTNTWSPLNNKQESSGE